MLEFELTQELERISLLKKSSDIYRMGTLFMTEFNNYFYDTGTGKVVLLDDNSYSIFESLFNA